MSPRSSERADAGFSLVEALVALAVFATACVGLFAVQTMSARSLAAVEARTLAGLLAQNMLVDAVASPGAPVATETTQTFAGRSWRVTASVSTVPESALRRVRIVVREQDHARPDADLTSFVPDRADTP